MQIPELENSDFKFTGNKAEIVNPKFKNKNGMIMIKAEWCGYCKKAKPEFEKAQNFFGGASAFGYVDYEKNPRLCEKLKANSFPTIKLIKDGKISPEKYDGERTKAAFIDEVVSSQVL